MLRFDYFDLDFIPDAKLVLDVLRAAHASEDSATHHDAKLGGVSLSFLHRMRRQNDSRLLVSLADLLNDLPHEAASFGVHTG